MMDMQRSDCKMLQYICEVRWEDRVSSMETARKCGLVEVSVKVWQRRLKWFGHMRRKNMNFVSMVEEHVPQKDPEKLEGIVSGKTWKS